MFGLCVPLNFSNKWSKFITKLLNILTKVGGLSDCRIAARPKAQVSGRLVAGIAGSDAAEGMDVCLLCVYVV
jgi:hypothetical protein